MEEPLEDFNLLGTGFEQHYSGDATGKDFPLSLFPLDSTLVMAKVDNVVLAEGTDFTVDRATGIVTFTVAPSVGTNNVQIIAHKTFVGFPDRIKKCTFNTLFGGNNDTRVFVSGNPDYPNQIWRSGLFDPTYFPENGYYKVGSDRERVMGFAKQYDYLSLKRNHQKEICSIRLMRTVTLRSRLSRLTTKWERSHQRVFKSSRITLYRLVKQACIC